MDGPQEIHRSARIHRLLQLFRREHPPFIRSMPGQKQHSDQETLRRVYIHHMLEDNQLELWP